MTKVSTVVYVCRRWRSKGIGDEKARGMGTERGGKQTEDKNRDKAIYNQGVYIRQERA